MAAVGHAERLCSDDCKPPRRLAASRATASIDCRAESALRGESGVVLLEDEAAAIGLRSPAHGFPDSAREGGDGVLLHSRVWVVDTVIRNNNTTHQHYSTPHTTTPRTGRIHLARMFDYEAKAVLPAA